MNTPIEPFPEEFHAMSAEKSGRPIYCTRLQEPNWPFLSDGHPHVTRLFKATYRLVNVEEVPIDDRPERKESWYDRNDRPR